VGLLYCRKQIDEGLRTHPAREFLPFPTKFVDIITADKELSAKTNSRIWSASKQRKREAAGKLVASRSCG